MATSGASLVGVGISLSAEPAHLLRAQTLVHLRAGDTIEGLSVG